MSDITRVVCNFSFGLGSWCAAKRMVEEFGKDKVFLVFADVKWEDEDTYAWGRKAAEVLGCRLFEIEEGRTPWQTFEDSNYIGNSAVDPCSKILKRQLIDRWLSRFFRKSKTLLAFGIHWSEQHRFYRIDRETGKPAGIKTRLNKLGWKHVRAPLCEVPYIGVHDMEKMAEDAGLWKQKLYQLGFPRQLRR